MLYKNAGEKLLKFRRRLGLSGVKLAEKSNVCAAYIWNLENGLALKPSVEKMKMLADALGVSMGFMIDNHLEFSDKDEAKKIFYYRFENLKPVDQVRMMKILEVLCK